MTIRTDAYRPSRPLTPSAHFSKRILTIGGCAGLLGMSGCAAWLGKDTPGTRIAINPITRTISFEDTRDNDAKIRGMQYADGTRSFSVEQLDIIQNSSDPRRANAEQMQVTAQVQIAANEVWGGIVSDLIRSAPALVGAMAQLRNTGGTPVPPEPDAGGTPTLQPDAGGTPTLRPPTLPDTSILPLGGRPDGDASGAEPSAPEVVDFPAIFGGQP